MKFDNFDWIVILSKKFRTSYLFISIFISIFYILYNYYFSRFIVGHDYWGFKELFTVLSISVLLFLELSGVQYFLNATQETFKKLEINNDITSNFSIYKKLEDLFSNKKRYYIIAFLIIFLFIIIDPIRGTYFLWSLKYGISIITVLYDALNYITTFLIFSSIATFFWIMLNISSLISTLGDHNYTNNTQLSIYCEGTLIVLTLIKNLILQITIFNSICITMLLPIYVIEKELNIELIFVVILASFGLYLFIQGWYVLNKIVNIIKYNQINVIDNLYINQHKKLNEIILKQTSNDEEKLNIIKILEFLKAEREQINLSFKTVYDIWTIIAFISSQILPFIGKHQIFFIEKLKMELVNTTLSILNQNISFVSH